MTKPMAAREMDFYYQELHGVNKRALLSTDVTDDFHISRGGEQQYPLPTTHTHYTARTLLLTSFWFSFLVLFYFRLAACFHASRLARLSPAYLRRAHNCLA